MARIIDMAEEAAKRLPINSDVQVLPSERECDYDGANMTLIILTSDNVMLRIHKCPRCGYERRYGSI